MMAAPALVTDTGNEPYRPKDVWDDQVIEAFGSWGEATLLRLCQVSDDFTQQFFR